MRLAWEWG